MKQLDFIQAGRETRRFHGLPMLEYQRVDAHSYGVAMLVRMLARDLPVDRRYALVTAALEHDLAEHKIGDIPAPTKRAIPGLRQACGEYEAAEMAAVGLSAESDLSATEQRLLKLADAAEGCLHLIEERRKGNAHPRIIYCFHEFFKYCRDEQELGHKGVEGELRDHIVTAWKVANGGEF